ncbi:MAG: Crp/Fnr family transcriptional regulator [Bacteroidota bacterium]
MENAQAKLRAAIAAIDPVPEPDLAALVAGFQPCTFAKKEIVVGEGEICHYLYYMLDGTFRAFLDKDKEYTIAFSYPPFFAALPTSFLTQNPSRLYLEAVTESHCLAIHHREVAAQLMAHPRLERTFRLFHERMIIGMQFRELELVSTTMRERFEGFCQRSFHLFARVPHKHIASYLNIDPTNLSKLLRERKQNLV